MDYRMNSPHQVHWPLWGGVHTLGWTAVLQRNHNWLEKWAAKSQEKTAKDNAKYCNCDRKAPCNSPAWEQTEQEPALHKRTCGVWRTIWIQAKNAPLQKLNAKGTLDCTSYSRTSKQREIIILIHTCQTTSWVPYFILSSLVYDILVHMESQTRWFGAGAWDV